MVKLIPAVVVFTLTTHVVGKKIAVQIMPIPETVLNIPGRESNATAELIFLASELPPLGFKSYYIQLEKGDAVVKAAHFQEHYENVNTNPLDHYLQALIYLFLIAGSSYKSRRRLRTHNRNYHEWKDYSDQTGVLVLSWYGWR